MIRYKTDWNGALRKQLIRRPTPVPSHESPDIKLDDCAYDSLQIFSLFLPVSWECYFNLFAFTFGEGKTSGLNITQISTKALSDCADKPEYRAKYMTTALRPITLWLTEFAEDSWDYKYNTVRLNGLADLIQKDSANSVRYFVFCEIFP